MNALFVVLLLISIVAFIVGLTNPSAVKLKSRKRVGLVFGIAIVVLIILAGATTKPIPATTVVAPVTTPAVATASAPAAQSTQAAASAPAPKKVTPPTPVATPVAAPQPTPPAPAPAYAASWHTAYTYSNNVDIKTPPFSMQGSKWRVTYSCSTSAEALKYGTAGMFYGYIYSADDGSMTDNFASFVTCPASDTSYLYAQTPGQYYLDLSAPNSSYTVTVEDFY